MSGPGLRSATSVNTRAVFALAAKIGVRSMIAGFPRSVFHRKNIANQPQQHPIAELIFAELIFLGEFDSFTLEPFRARFEIFFCLLRQFRITQIG